MSYVHIVDLESMFDAGPWTLNFGRTRTVAVAMDLMDVVDHCRTLTIWCSEKGPILRTNMLL